LRDIGEARLALMGTASPVTSTMQMPASMVSVSGAGVAAPRSRPWPWIAATAVLGVLVAALLPTSSLVRSDATNAAVESLELAIAAPPGTEFQIGSNLGNVILSPDGTRIAFVATAKTTTIWVRSLAKDDARSIPGTENASNPFWSPDGRHIGFFANGKLRTVDIAGGLPEIIADAPGGRGGAWSEDGTIIFSPTGGAALSRVSATGGAVSPLTTLDAARGENAHYWPVFLPGGRRYLYFVRSTQVENAGIYLGHMDGASPVRLVASLSSGIVARHPVSGAWYLLWARDQDLLAQPFDIESGALSGAVATIATGVRVEESQRLLYASASLNGHLAWANTRAGETALALYNRDGRRIRYLDIPSGVLYQPAFSPDGTRLLFIRVERGGSDIFLHDLRSGVTERLTTDPDYDEMPFWTPDGRAFTYLGRAAGHRVGFRMEIGTGAPPVQQTEEAFGSALESPDGRYAIYTRPYPRTAADIVATSLGAAGATTVLVQEPGADRALAQSADGRTVLLSQESNGRSVLAVTRVRAGAAPAIGNLLTVADGAVYGALRPDGKEVIAVTLDGVVKAVAISPAGDTLTIGGTTVLFRVQPGVDNITVNPAGTEFVVNEFPHANGQTLRVLTRWDARLK
jgi:Tol biopolymer transport system component